jgi:hypothetical protein
MRDIIWTIIIVWLIIKIAGIIKHASQMRAAGSSADIQPKAAETKRDLKGAVQQHLNNEGEYVDFEEVK